MSVYTQLGYLSHCDKGNFCVLQEVIAYFERSIIYRFKIKRKFNNFDWSRNLNISKVKIVTKSEGLNCKYIGFK